MPTTSSVDRSFAALQALHTSWNNQAQELGCQDSSVPVTLVKKLLVVGDGDQFSVTKKPVPTFFGRLIKFIFGGPERENFRLQMQKIKQLFETIKTPLTDAQKAEMALLEEKLNTLGRYVFCRRQQKTLFCCMGPELSGYQSYYTTPTELIKPGVIMRHLKNWLLENCWLNSAIKLIAATTHYDPILVTPFPDPDLEKVRQALFRLIEALRKNWDQRLVDILHDDLLIQLEQSPFSHFLHQQEDADFFLQGLENQYNQPTLVREQVKFLKYYESQVPGIYRTGQESVTTRLHIYPNETAQTINLEACYMAKELSEPINSYFVFENERLVPSTATHTPLSFYVQDACTHLPEYLEVSLNRGRSYDRNTLRGNVTHKKIDLERGGKVTLHEYEPLYQTIGDQRIIVGVKPKARVTYLVMAALEQRGDTNLRGHYLAHTRSPTGCITTHNDSQVLQNQTEEAWGHSYYLHLKRLERVPFR